MKEYPETHQQGTISIENADIFSNIVRGDRGEICSTMEGDIGVQIARDGRIWICINGIAFLRFKPKR